MLETIWILFILHSGPSNWNNITTAEFEGKIACETAVAELQKDARFKAAINSTMCLPKARIK